jgi:hypothetical protein
LRSCSVRPWPAPALPENTDARRGADARARAGVCLYNTFLRNIQLRTVFFWLTLVGVLAGCTQLVLVTGARALPGDPACGGDRARADVARFAGLNRTLGLSDELFVLVDSVLLTGLGRVMLMPTLVLAARICPEARPPAPCAVSRRRVLRQFLRQAPFDASDVRVHHVSIAVHASFGAGARGRGTGCRRP